MNRAQAFGLIEGLDTFACDDCDWYREYNRDNPDSVERARIDCEQHDCDAYLAARARLRRAAK
jgi:hypothetical protein